MNSIKKVFFLLSIICLFNECGIQNRNPGTISISSPDGKIRVEIYKGADSKLLYKVEANGKEIITPSQLGIESDSIDLGSNIRFGSVESGRIDKAYSVFGVHNKGYSFNLGRDYCPSE